MTTLQKSRPPRPTRDNFVAECRSEWLLLGSAVVLGLVSFACLFLLSFSYTPHHMERLAELDAALPMPTVLAVRTSIWFVRLLPFVVVGTVLIAPVVAAVLVVAFMRFAPHRVLRAIAIVVLCLGLAGFVASGLILYGMHAAYRTVEQPMSPP